MKGKEFVIIKGFKVIDDETFVEVTKSIEHPQLKENENSTRSVILLGGVLYKYDKEKNSFKAKVYTKVAPSTEISLNLLKPILSRYNKNYLETSWKLLKPYINRDGRFDFHEKLAAVPTLF